MQIQYKAMTVSELEDIFNRNHDCVTVVEFAKRSSRDANNPTIRTMKCTRAFDMLEANVSKFNYIKPTNEPNYDSAAYNLVRVWDLENEGWRSIPTDRIISVSTEAFA